MPAGECFVVGGPNSSATNGTPTIGQGIDFDPDIQNSGSTADAVGLFHSAASAISGSSIPEDVVVYGGANNSAFKGPDGNVISAPHVDDASAGQSLLRTTKDTWIISNTPNAETCTVIF